MRPLEIPRRLLQSFVLLGLLACGGSTVTDTPGPGTNPPVDTIKPPATVQRASVTVQVTIDPADAALAQQAGLTVSGITVRLNSSRPSDPVRTAVTGADGMVRFDNLLEGLYTATADRTLTTVEVARLSPSDRESSVFAGAGTTALAPPANGSTTIALVGARRGSLVISEVFANYGPLQYTEPNYVFGSYIEVYNNTDTTAYLDGMMLATTVTGWYVNDDWNGACTEQPKMLRLDSTAIYTGLVMAFPGTGREYPIRAGEAKVVAMDAMNHAAAAPTKEQVDLSRAHFEQYWSDADIDNPDAVNMVRLVGSTGVFGRGFPYFSSSLMQVLLSPQALSAATRVTVPNRSASGWGTIELTRVPSEYIVDLMSLEYTPYVYTASPGSPRCNPWTSPRYDRAPAYLGHLQQRKAITRKGLGFTADGREILQRTKNSERDLQWAEPLRRSLNK